MGPGPALGKLPRPGGLAKDLLDGGSDIWGDDNDRRTTTETLTITMVLSLHPSTCL